MTYAPPTLAELAPRIRRAIRDEAAAVFATAQIVDFVNAGLAELDQIRPLEDSLTVSAVGDFAGLAFDGIWWVELVAVAGTGQMTIPPDNTDTNWRSGWLYYASDLTFAPALYNRISELFDAGSHVVNVYGYTPRERVDWGSVGDDVPQYQTLVEEEAAIEYATLKAYSVLLSDRSLFQQWQAATNNTDVSPTQLMNMGQIAQSNWTQTRHRLHRSRRQPLGVQ